MKKVINVSVVVTWLGVVGRVKWIIFLTLFSTPVPVTGWGLSSSKLSSDEYSIITFRSTLPPGLGTGFFPLPMAKGFPPVFFLAVCFVWAIHARPYLTVVRYEVCVKLGECSSFMWRHQSCDQLATGPYLELVGSASNVCLDGQGL